MPRTRHRARTPARRAAVALVVAAAVLATAPLVAAPPADPFKGKWEATDAVDGSNETMSFGGNGDTRRVTLHDDDGTVACDPDGGPVTARGIGTISADGSEISVDFSWRCASGQTGGGVITFTHDAATDTLTEASGTVWHRSGGGP